MHLLGSPSPAWARKACVRPGPLDSFGPLPPSLRLEAALLLSGACSSFLAWVVTVWLLQV